MNDLDSKTCSICDNEFLQWDIQACANCNATICISCACTCEDE